jgi:4-hydroxy-tetrahydrodipicolinate synthase
MATPFDKNFEIDTVAVARIINSFVEANVAPFLLGTTGESVSISESQKVILVKTAVKALNKKGKLYAGISGNCLQESLESAKIFADLGADAVVAHLPFYYPVDADQMLRYYEHLANKVTCPLILYNNPITTKHSVPVEVIERLSYHPNIAGIKDSERGMERLDLSLKLWSNRADFVHLTGWAAQSAYALLNGSDGIIPSTGNVIPKLYTQLFIEATSNNASKANELQDIANSISEIYQKDRNLSQSLPALKVMMSAIGLCDPFVMPPMYELNEFEVENIKKMTIDVCV